MRTTTRRARRGTRLLAATAACALVLAACNGDDADTDGVDDADGVEDDAGVDDEDIDDDADADADPDEDVDDDADDADDDAAATDDERPGFLTMATGSTGGTYFPLGGAMAGVWNDNIDDLQVGTQSSGASVENLRLLDAGEVDLILAVNGVAAEAHAGEGEFEEPLDIAFLGNVYAEVMQIVATEASGIESIADLDGARVAIGPPGSGTEVIAREILEAEGIDPDNDIDAFSESFGDAADGLRDGQIDAIFAILALPAGAVEEVATATDLTYVPIEGELLDGLLEADDTLSSLEVEPDTYPGQDEAVTWVTNWATLYAPPELNEDLVYDLVSVMYEEQQSVADAIAVGDQIQLDTALDGRSDIPMHPGAERYFEEAGAS
jgi:TRAP transporter TAXI family solute receptor